jgi:hypothetical protein
MMRQPLHLTYRLLAAAADDGKGRATRALHADTCATNLPLLSPFLFYQILHSSLQITAGGEVSLGHMNYDVGITSVGARMDGVAPQQGNDAIPVDGGLRPQGEQTRQQGSTTMRSRF